MRALVLEYDQTQGVIVRSARDAILPDRA
jgi:hypothetical protein